ncbi:Ninja-family protein AFP3 [Camellia lanceoleosa]|uniref:Ninja-family protein AFP3 n=1 Tax=Camellia lanceoleosa TaxID=1840588 RepID=A0ACC0HTX4_9ERIC|nr:Ninja-family protein AFP3 [Camellia lanceoleosa]
MASNRAMLEVSRVGEDDEEIELSLALSVGGSFRNSTKLNPQVEKTINSDADLISQENQCLSRSSTINPVVGDSEPECLDPHRKREIQALRRQEARKKREEKLRKGVVLSDDKMLLETQRLQNWVRDREMREKEANVAERTCKRDKKGIGNKCVVVNEEEMKQHNEAPNLSQGGSIPVQYVPLAYPCVMPCWDPNVVGWRSLQPYQGNLNSGCNPLIGSDSEHNNGGKDGGNRNAVSNGSPVWSSSVVSEHGSTSRQGGSSSSDTGRSHSSHCKPEQSQLNAASKQLGQSEHSVSSNYMDSAQANAKATNCTEKTVSPGIIQSHLTKHSKQTHSVGQPDPVENNINKSQNPNPGPSKVANRDLSKPPKPKTQSIPSFSQMPCVSTTGNGPNGKTITGFLYRYTKTEVSIVCVCHGSSFSPAEFVEHAGGKDITHPLRHITVIPSAFG